MLGRSVLYIRYPVEIVISEAVLQGPTGPVAATVRPLELRECIETLAQWKLDPIDGTLARHRTCLRWPWGDVLVADSGEVFTIEVADRPVGMIEFHYDARCEDRSPAVGLLRLARRPSAFLPPEIKGVAKPLVLAMVSRSFDTNHLGQVVISEALGPSQEDPSLDARIVYEVLGFRTIRKNPGENSFVMELTSLSARTLLRRAVEQA